MGETMQSLQKALSKLAALSSMVVSAGIAYAGPSNRGPIPSQLNGPSVGLGSPLPAVEGNSSDLQIFITGQTNFQEVEHHSPARSGLQWTYFMCRMSSPR